MKQNEGWFKPIGIEKAREFFEKEGYTLLSAEYTGYYGVLDFICPNGHKHSMQWRSWQIGIRCAYCYYDSLRKITLEDIRRSFEKEGYTLISTADYKNNRQKFAYICPMGHKGSSSWANWIKGCRCWVCGHIERSGENASNWRGGVSAEPYCQIWLDREFKESIKERDRYTCLNPFCKRITELLNIHHIDYNKKNCHPLNLITLCVSCNVMANYNKEWYEAWYQRIIQIRYN